MEALLLCRKNDEVVKAWTFFTNATDVILILKIDDQFPTLQLQARFFKVTNCAHEFENKGQINTSTENLDHGWTRWRRVDLGYLHVKSRTRKNCYYEAGAFKNQNVLISPDLS